MVVGSSLLVISVLAMALAYLYVPFPDYASDPLMKSANSASAKFKRLLINAFDTTGILKDVDMIRFFDEMSMKMFPPKSDANVEVSKTIINGVNVLVHKPKNVKNDDLLPGLIFFHGGGWVSRSAESYQSFTTYLSKKTNAVLISVNYRLAPEHIHPVPFEDCLKVTEHVLQNARQYGIERRQVGIAGDGTGGNLALAVAINASEKYVDNSYKVRVVGLFYPAIQAFDFNLPSYIKYSTGPGTLWKEDVLDQYMYYLFGKKDKHIKDQFRNNMHTSPALKDKYDLLFDIEQLPYSFRSVDTPSPPKHTGNKTLSKELQSLFLDKRVSPMMLNTDDMDVLPCTFFIAAEFDPLRDESFMAYAALRNTDLDKSEHVYYRTEQHGFLEEFKDNSEAQDAIHKFVRYFKKVLRVGEL